MSLNGNSSVHPAWIREQRTLLARICIMCFIRRPTLLGRVEMTTNVREIAFSNKSRVRPHVLLCTRARCRRPIRRLTPPDVTRHHHPPARPYRNTVHASSYAFPSFPFCIRQELPVSITLQWILFEMFFFFLKFRI